MNNRETRRFQDAIWLRAHDIYAKEHDEGLLWKAPKEVQETYQERARGEMRAYLSQLPHSSH